MQDRLRSIIDVLVDIDDPAAGADLARRAHLSRFHFDRVSAAILGESPAGRTFVEATDTSAAGMRERLARAGSEFATLVQDVAHRNAWDTAFVDATCDPPESFTFGGAVSRVLGWDSHRRQIVAAALRERGLNVSADPIAWERMGD